MMQAEYAKSGAIEDEWSGGDKADGPVAGQLMRLEKSVAALMNSAGMLEERLQSALTPEQDELAKVAEGYGDAPRPLHSPIAMALGTVVNKIERVTKQIEGMRSRVEL